MLQFYEDILYNNWSFNRNSTFLLISQKQILRNLLTFTPKSSKMTVYMGMDRLIYSEYSDSSGVRSPQAIVLVNLIMIA